MSRERESLSASADLRPGQSARVVRAPSRYMPDSLRARRDRVALQHNSAELALRSERIARYARRAAARLPLFGEEQGAR